MQIRFVDEVLHVSDLSYKKILFDISFNIKRGEYVAIVGPNGGGKSTLLKLILGLLKADAGEIKLFSKPPKTASSLHKIGFVPQLVSQVDLGFPATAFEVVKMGFAYKCSFFKKESKQELSQAEELMQRLGVWELRDRLIGELSGGQRQKVMLTRALVGAPQMLILDEPYAGVDANSQRAFYSLLKELNEKQNMTILLVTHDLGVVANDIKKVLCINETMLSCQSPQELLSCSKISELYGIDAHILHHNHTGKELYA